MARPVTLFTGQWADLPLEVDLPEGQQVGLRRHRAALLGRPLQRPAGAQATTSYCKGRHDLLAKYGLKCWAISNHLVGQAVCDLIDERHKLILPDARLGRRQARRASSSGPPRR